MKMLLLYSLGNTREWITEAAAVVVAATDDARIVAIATTKAFKVLMSSFTCHRVTSVVNTILPIDSSTITQNNLHTGW